MHFKLRGIAHRHQGGSDIVIVCAAIAAGLNDNAEILCGDRGSKGKEAAIADVAARSLVA